MLNQVTISPWASTTPEAYSAPSTVVQQPRRRAAAKYDAASPQSNETHWRQADLLSANAADSPDVRQTLRMRCRHEVKNNSYAEGVTKSYANEIVGCGPRLQMRIPGNRDANRAIERVFNEWVEASWFYGKLNTLVRDKFVNGEGCAIVQNNPAIDHQVQLDILTIEADQLASPQYGWDINQPVDGIVLDSRRNPIAYHVLDEHPGEVMSFANLGTYSTIPARNFLHWFRQLRSGQFRGIPELTPALNLFAQLRRWTLAVLTGAEAAANFSAVLYTAEGTPVYANETTYGNMWESVPVEMGMYVTMPPGYRVEQLKAEQPVATYHTFKHELLKEIARCLCMPYPIVAGDSSLSNYASGRLDFQSWFRTVKVDRASCERQILNRVFRMFLAEAASIKGLLPRGLDTRSLPHGWFYDAVPHVDPIKDGTGDSLAIANCTDTLANICAAQGQDWEEVLEQRALEVQRQRELKLDIYLPDYDAQVQKDIAEAYAGDQQSSGTNASFYAPFAMFGGRN